MKPIKEIIPEFLLLIGCAAFGKRLRNIPIPEIQGAVGVCYDKQPFTGMES
jgi:hypothetical protein